MIPTRMGFEPTRAEPIGLAVQRLNHSATSSTSVIISLKKMFPCNFTFQWFESLCCFDQLKTYEKQAALQITKHFYW